MKWSLTAEAAAQAWRDEMRRQFRAIVILESTVSDGSVEALHDLRVAIRRLRVLLRALEKPLAHTTAKKLARRWRNFTRGLSSLRDADVWRALLRELPEASPAFQRRVQDRLEQFSDRLAGLPTRYVWLRLKWETQTLLKKEAPAALKHPAQARPDRALQKTWIQATARAAKLAHSPQLAQADAAHKLRIACRRARYLAEFLALACPSGKACRAWQKAARCYLAAQDALGQTHDADALLNFLRIERLRPNAALRAVLIRRRLQGVARFQKIWKRLDV